jgi:cytochrome c-type biogenesis protein CcmE
MKPTHLKLAIAGLIVAGAISYLAVAGASSGGWVYFMDVDRFVADAQAQHSRVRLHGKVVDDDHFAVNGGSLTARFTLAGKTNSVPVCYRGAIPDMFKAGGEVVVEGKRDSSGVFQADVLMTKCASKYEPASPHGSDAGGATSTAKQREARS